MKIFDEIKIKNCPICYNRQEISLINTKVICESNIYHTTYDTQIYIYRNNYFFKYKKINNKFILNFYDVFANEKFNLNFDEDITIKDLYLMIDKYIENMVFE